MIYILMIINSQEIILIYDRFHMRSYVIHIINKTMIVV